MFEQEKNGYKRSEVDHYIKRLDDDFQNILKSHTERLEDVKRNIADIAKELNTFNAVVPKYKSEIDSMRERLENIRGWAAAASKARYIKNTDLEALLANFITQVLVESDKIHELKPVVASEKKQINNDDFFEILATSKDIKLEDALEGFDFYDNNPYKEKAEKNLAKINKKKKK